MDVKDVSIENQELNQKVLPDSTGKQFSDQVIDLYEKCLQNALVISTSFKNVLENKLDNKRRALQLIFIFISGYSAVRHLTCCFIYLKEEETRKYWDYFIPNYFNELGLFGKVLTFGFAVFSSIMFVDVLYLRSFESKGRLDYQTNMDSLRDKKKRHKNFSFIEVETNEDESGEETEVLGEKEKEKLLKEMKTKLVILKTIIKLTILSAFSYHVIPCPLFLFNQKPHVLTGILAVFHMILMLFLMFYGPHFLFNMYTSYMLTVDYFSSRIDYMMKGLEEDIILEDNLTRVLFLYNKLMLDFRKQDYLLKYLLRNMMYGYCTGLAVLFLLFTVHMNPFLRIIVLTAVTTLSSIMLASGLYVGRLYSMTLVLYTKLNSINSRNQGIKTMHSLKIRRNLLNCIKELGSKQTDGQFVLGLRDGNGAATSSNEMFQLTLATISNTLMAMEFVYHSR